MYRYPNYDHLIAGLNSAIAQADQMDLATAQTVDSITRALQRENDNLDQIDVVHRQINQTGQVSIRDMNKVESIVTGTIDRAGGAQLFSFNPTANNLEGAVEAINWAKIGKIGIIGAIVAAILAIIYKIFKFMKSGKVDEIAKDIIDDQKKQEAALKKNIVSFEFTFSPDKNRLSAEDRDRIINDNDSFEEMQKKLHNEADRMAKQEKEKRLLEREARRKARTNTKLDLSIPETVKMINQQYSTNFSQSDISKGFSKFFDIMSEKYTNGENSTMTPVTALAEMAFEAKMFLLNNIPAFSEKRKQLAILFICASPNMAKGYPSLAQNYADYKVAQMEAAVEGIKRLSILSGEYKEHFESKLKHRPGTTKISDDWSNAGNLLVGVSSAHYFAERPKGGLEENILEKVIAELEKNNYDIIRQGFEIIKGGTFDIVENSLLANVEKSIAKLKSVTEAIKPSVEVLEKNSKAATEWLDNIITGKQLNQFIDAEDAAERESQIKNVRGAASHTKSGVNKFNENSRKVLKEALSYASERQELLGFCMTAKGTHSALTNTAIAIANSISKEITSRLND